MNVIDKVRGVSENLDFHFFKRFPTSKKLESMTVAGLFLLLFLIIALPKGFQSTIGGIGLPQNSSALEIRNAWGQGDAGSLLEMALSWSKFQPLDPVTQYWIPRLWSPGLPLLEIPMIWIENLGIPIFWSLLLTTIFIWVSVVYFFWKYVSPIIGRTYSIILLLILALGWDARYFFRDSLFYTEGIAYGLLIIGLGLANWTFIFAHQNPKRLLGLSGALIGISIWIRHTNDTGLILSLLCSLIFFGLTNFKKSQSNPASNFQTKYISRILLLFNLVALAVTIPWRFLAHFVYQGAPFLMSSASYLIAPNLWAKPGSPTDIYWGGLGINWACKIDMQQCLSIPNDPSGTFERSKLIFLALRAAITNPTDYIFIRLESLAKNWTPSFLPLNNLFDLIAVSFGIIFISCIILFYKIKNRQKYLTLILWLPYLVAQLAQLLIIHFESRYFIIVRLLILGLFANLLIIFQLERKNQSKISNDTEVFIHPKAICDSKNIGAGTKIWAFSHVSPGAKIGNNCNICENIYIENKVLIGNNVTIKNGVQIWDGITIENNVFIGPNVTFTNDKFPRSKHHRSDYEKTLVKSGASIGANATILPGLIIGEYAMIGAGSVVTKSVPDRTLVLGNPARFVKKIDSNLE